MISDEYLPIKVWWILHTHSYILYILWPKVDGDRFLELVDTVHYLTQSPVKLTVNTNDHECNSYVMDILCINYRSIKIMHQTFSKTCNFIFEML